MTSIKLACLVNCNRHCNVIVISIVFFIFFYESYFYSFAIL